MTVLRRWPLSAMIASAAMLAAAHAFETFGRLAPCHLCLKQREVYWVVIAICAVTLLLEAAARLTSAGPMTRPGAAVFVSAQASIQPLVRRVPHPASLVLALAFLFGAGLAAFHAGVEWKWWPGPTTCTSGGVARVTAADLGGLLKGAGGAAPMCDKAAWVFLGLSMAGWNAIISLGLAATSLIAAFRKDAAP